MSIINQIVDRCHVGLSNRAVIRYVVSRFRGGWRGWHAMPKRDRKQILRATINRHYQNRRLYHQVMSGHF